MREQWISSAVLPSTAVQGFGTEGFAIAFPTCSYIRGKVVTSTEQPAVQNVRTIPFQGERNGYGSALGFSFNFQQPAEDAGRGSQAESHTEPERNLHVKRSQGDTGKLCR